MTKFAVIGGTGLNNLPDFEPLQEHDLDTPWGAPSAPIVAGRYAGAECLFLARHGVPHHIAPHRINYRANLWALREMGTEAIISVNAVGGIRSTMQPGHIVLPDQIVDYTWGRGHTYYDDDTVPVEHVDFTEPYDRNLRQRLAEIAGELGLDFSAAGVYAATQGPRLESAAEIRRLDQDGCDVVGMTGMPETGLAGELDIPYAAICLVVNPAAGLSEQPITLASMQAVLERGTELLGALLKDFLQVPDQGLAPSRRERTHGD